MAGVKSVPSYTALQDRVDFVAKKALPNALTQLSNRQESFEQVVRHLEDNYIKAQRSGTDKAAVEKDAQQYVATGLINVLKDIEFAAASIDQMVTMQTLSVNSLATDIEVVQSRLHAAKGQHLISTLDEMKVPNEAITSTTAPPAVRDVAPAAQFCLLTTASSKTENSSAANSPVKPATAAVVVGEGSTPSIGLDSELERSGSANSSVLEDAAAVVAVAVPAASSGKVMLGGKRRKSIEERLVNLQSIGTGTGTACP